MYNFMPDIDLDDPAVQDELRRLSIPSALLDGLHAVGRMAYQNAAELTVPGIVVQGNNDLVVGLNNHGCLCSGSETLSSTTKWTLIT
ncbi:MAG: hypothetical protein R2856_09665 [Caldilineaceae bacterium]